MEKTIQISGLSKSYDGKKVIENLSFSVAAGEVYGLLGANGVGKSTTIECILGTKKADSGTVRILGLDPWTERKQLFKQVGVQFQEANYPDKIKVKELCEETICLYRYPLAYKELLHKFGLADKENAFVNELSGGQKQRLFIVLSLIPDPRVVFLDELAASWVVIGFRAWVATDNYWPAKWRLNEKIKESFDREGIELAYPQMDIHIKKQ